jgi:hypothetical protein
MSDTKHFLRTLEPPKTIGKPCYHPAAGGRSNRNSTYLSTSYMMARNNWLTLAAKLWSYWKSSELCRQIESGYIICM